MYIIRLQYDMQYSIFQNLQSFIIDIERIIFGIYIFHL